MFHLLIILPIIFALIVFFSILFFSITAIVAACVGGTSVAVLIKNKLVKKLLLLGFGVVLLIGLLCLIPIILMYTGLSSLYFVAASNLIYLCIAALAIAGIKLSCSIKNKAVKVILIIIFCFILFAVITFAIIADITSYFLLR